MPIIEDLPDLSHWKTVQEFSISQAAMLLAGIDPYDFENGLDEVKTRRHERWKMAWGISEGIISAIRRGVLTPVQCFAVRWVEHDQWNGYWEYYEIKPTDRKNEISKDKTLITRDSLFVWVENERVDFVRKPVPVKIETTTSGWESNLPSVVIDSEHCEVKESLLLLPKYEHNCEGLEFVEEAIKQFWSTYDETDPSTAPTKMEVTDYLKNRGASNNLAEAVDLVLRPFSVRKVGRRKSIKTTR
ncbi:hypothetical protein [Enterobacter roggenkampii]|uniref:Uncharacterized protein n=1 Tax=Enterobacter roggenkampii TaxID=1812935 RepID=A0AAX1WIB3_9ENTR|nr:hypothetical protein [Enterobacter roggenkampii]CAE6276380.1 hypothetical protein AI2705V1_3249 [Enterobacter cloacae]EHF8257433.1 hypothetical protein [Enterobacter roggenkampii]ELD8600426.1 hypothetical protein [Enterobacter roggenkampii]QFQ81962.1 hypothetical protein GIX98_20240 [Enterobacter roggenkampii]RNT42237.1 hypothetical protein B9059_011675 [Enterobacter roggenkampii]